MQFKKSLFSLAVAAAFTAQAAEFNISEATNDFGFKVMSKAVQSDFKNSNQLKNTMTSPISAHLAFSMAANGTAEKSLETILNFLRAPSLGELNQQSQALQRNLIKEDRPAPSRYE